MEIKGTYRIILFSIALSSCAINPPSPSTSAINLTAPEINETSFSNPASPEDKSTSTQDIHIAQPPLLSDDTIDCVLNLLIEKECGGFILEDLSN